MLFVMRPGLQWVQEMTPRAWMHQLASGASSAADALLCRRPAAHLDRRPAVQAPAGALEALFYMV